MIRRALPADAEAVTLVFRESRAEALPWLPVLHSEEEDPRWFRRALAGEAWVLEEDGEVLGYAGLRDDELHDRYVAPAAQGRGVGSVCSRTRAGPTGRTASASGRSATTRAHAASTTRAAAG